MTKTKAEILSKWLNANPDKSERDWLLEVRCRDDRQREELLALFDRVDANPIFDLEVCPVEDYAPLNGDHVIYSTEKDTLPETGSALVEYDFRVGSFMYDLAAPDDVYVIDDPKRPWMAAWKFLRWKGKQIGIEPESFAKWAWHNNIDMRTGYKHWREILNS